MFVYFIHVCLWYTFLLYTSLFAFSFELGKGVEADQIKCPRNWVQLGSWGSCYKFTRSPIRKWDEARQICMAYRHQGGHSTDWGQFWD